MYLFRFDRALSALNNAYLGNVMGTNVVTHRDSNPSIYLHERVRVSKQYPVESVKHQVISTFCLQNKRFDCMFILCYDIRM